MPATPPPAAAAAAAAAGRAGLPVPDPTRSYWHGEPSARLLGHRTTPGLPAAADVVVVGSGMTGAWAAHFLKEGPARGGSVLVLEAREACWGATGRNGGHCQPFLYGSPPEVARFELETYRFLGDFVAAEGVDCSWRGLSGVHAFLTRDLFELAAADVEGRLRREAPDLADLVAVVRRGDGEGEEEEGGGEAPQRRRRQQQQHTLAGLRIPGAEGALVQRLAASLWPYKLVCWLLERLLAAFPAPGFNLQTGTPVTELVARAGGGGGGGGGGEHDDHPWLVRTPRGSVAARQVLLATNAYTSRLLPAFGDLIVPVRGQVAALAPPPGAPTAALEHSYVVLGEGAGGGRAATRDEYLVQRPAPGGELILGGGRHLARGWGVGQWRDDEVEEPVASFLREELEGWLDLRSGGAEGPAAAEGAGRGAGEGLEAREEWTGIMGYSLDRRPWVGRVPEGLGGGAGGLWLCGGYTGHGMPHAPLCARGVVRMMAGDGQPHGVPAAFVVGEERAAAARRDHGDVMAGEAKGAKAMFAAAAG